MADELSRPEGAMEHPPFSSLDKLRPTEQIADSASDRIERARDDLPQNDQLGRYVLKRTLGVGSSAGVYHAFDTHLERQVAVKVPFPDVIARQAARERVRVEAIRAASLEHPNIVPVYDYGSTQDGRVFIVSKLICGRTYGAFLSVTTDLSERLAPLVAVARALAYAHQRGMVHRDVKPSNILVADDGTSWLTDFGLTVALHDQPTPAGTPLYMPPEQIRPPFAVPDSRTDVWALGVMLYEASVGRPPFAGGTRAQLSEAISRCEPPLPSHVAPSLPSEVDSVVMSCLQKDPQERWGSADWVASAISGIIASLPSS